MRSGGRRGERPPLIGCVPVDTVDFKPGCGTQSAGAGSHARTKTVQRPYGGGSACPTTGLLPDVRDRRDEAACSAGRAVSATGHEPLDRDGPDQRTADGRVTRGRRNVHALTDAGPAVDSAVVLDRFGDVDDLKLQPVPSRPLRATEVRINVAVAGLNPVDWQIVESPPLAAAFGLDLPMGFGNDFAGVVVETGTSVRRLRVGDRVFGGARGRAVATSLVLDEDHPSLHRTPAEISDLDAGILDIAGRTASAIAAALSVRPGETVLVGAAGGGVGSILTQLLVRGGAHVIGTGSAASADHIRSLGARPVPYGDGLAAAIAASKNPINAAADLHGTETAEVALRMGVPSHRVVTIEADASPTGVVQVNGSDATPDALERLLALVADKALRVPVAATYPLDQFHDAVVHQRSRHVHGKIAIRISAGSAICARGSRP
ncbi:NADP-dependent oxidoreductase [Curtobacterium luteum]|uniref:NADP-dependent oxidoreductase n=1 Tax=Curtobacterium luteum TaxID=33881 RepID=UPI00382EAFAD